MRWSLAGLVATALALSSPADALAEIRYVANGGLDNTDCTNSGAPCATADHAAEVAADGDTIQIAAGVYTEEVETAKALTIVGAGGGTLGGIPAATLIRGPAGSDSAGSAALTLGNGGEVRSLRAEGGKGDSEALATGHPGGDAIHYDPIAPGRYTLRLDHVVAVGGDGGAGENADPFKFGDAGQGVDVRGQPEEIALSAVDSEFMGGTGTGGGGGIAVFGPDASADLVRSRIETEPSLATFPGIVGFSGARLSLDSVEIDADRFGATIFEGSMTIRRSRIQAAFPLEVSASGGDIATAEVVDSLSISTESTAAFVESEETGSTATLNAVGSTFVGLSVSAAVSATRDEGAGPASITLRNSIARHLPPPPVPPTDLAVSGGMIDADFSSFTTRLVEGGGSASAPGSAGNVAGDPLFADPSKGNFALQSVSPLIDRGNPALVAAGQLDLAGSPRSLDGNLDCAAAPDIGAFEVTGRGVPCADPIPVITKFGMTNRTFAPKGGKKPPRRSARASAKRKPVKRGTKFTYTLSEPAGVKIAIERKKAGGKGKKPRFAKLTTLSQQKKSGRQSTKFSGRVKGKPLKPGSYRATITATDSAGQKSQPRKLTFKIVSG